MSDTWKKVSELAAFLEESPLVTVVNLSTSGVALRNNNEEFYLADYKSKVVQRACETPSAEEARAIFERENPAIRTHATEDTLRGAIEANLLDVVGLRLEDRQGRGLSRFIMRQPSGDIITIQTYVATPRADKRGKAVNFTVYDLNNPDFENHWYAFAVSSFREPCVFSREEIKTRFTSKGKDVPNRTTITITPAVAEKNSIELRQDELRGEPDDETKMRLLEDSGDYY